MQSDLLPFNFPYLTGRELHYIAQSQRDGIMSGNGGYTKRCHAWLENYAGSQRALLTHSCTAALEMAALLLDLEPGDEVIMPAYTFVSTANAFVLRGARPVFVDIRPDTLNLDERLIEEAITPRTRAIVPVHYAGVGCDMDAICAVAARHGLRVVEDAAQAILATWRGKPLGALGDLGAFSFHETKNVHCGEGGALLVNDRALIARAEILRDKGTDRSRFDRGEVDRYTWQDLGSSFLPSDISAAFLLAQLEEAEALTARRREIWACYHTALEGLERAGQLRRPIVPPECGHNAHMYYILVAASARGDIIRELRARKIHSVFHYVPLHQSPAGQRLGRAQGNLPVTCRSADSLIRLPLWIGMTPADVDRVAAALEDVLLTQPRFAA